MGSPWTEASAFPTPQAGPATHSSQRNSSYNHVPHPVAF